MALGNLAGPAKRAVRHQARGAPLPNGCPKGNRRASLFPAGLRCPKILVPAPLPAVRLASRQVRRIQFFKTILPVQASCRALTKPVAEFGASEKPRKRLLAGFIFFLIGKVKAVLVSMRLSSTAVGMHGSAGPFAQTFDVIVEIFNWILGFCPVHCALRVVARHASEERWNGQLAPSLEPHDVRLLRGHPARV